MPGSSGEPIMVCVLPAGRGMHIAMLRAGSSPGKQTPGGSHRTQLPQPAQGTPPQARTGAGLAIGKDADLRGRAAPGQAWDQPGCDLPVGRTNTSRQRWQANWQGTWQDWHAVS